MKPPSLTLGLIWAQTRDGAIGTGSDMAWRIPGDFAHFKTVTMGHPIIQGARTFASLGHRPLPGRTSIVITHTERPPAPGVLLAHSVEEAYELAASLDERAWVIGGGIVYADTIGDADELVVTTLKAGACDFSTDLPTRAPRIDEALFAHSVDRSDPAGAWRDENELAWRIDYYERIIPDTSSHS